MADPGLAHLVNSGGNRENKLVGTVVGIISKHPASPPEVAAPARKRRVLPSSLHQTAHKSNPHQQHQPHPRTHQRPWGQTTSIPAAGTHQPTSGLSTSQHSLGLLKPPTTMSFQPHPAVGHIMTSSTTHATQVLYPPSQFVPVVPLLQLPGLTKYAATSSGIDALVQDMMDTGTKVLGFDMEWRVAFQKHVAPAKVALIQLAYYTSDQAASAAAAEAVISNQRNVPLHYGNVLTVQGPTSAPSSTQTRGITTTSTTVIRYGAMPALITTGVCNSQQQPLSYSAEAAPASMQCALVHAAPNAIMFSSSPAQQPPMPEADNAGSDGGDSGSGSAQHSLVVLLLQVSGLPRLPTKLEAVLEDPLITKAGMNVNGDYHKLLNDYGVTLQGHEELSDLAGTRVLRHRELITTDVTEKKRSLAGLLFDLLHVTLPKVQAIRCGNWEAHPLPYPMQRYAALDAYAGLLMHTLLNALPRRTNARLGKAEQGKSNACPQPIISAAGE